MKKAIVGIVAILIIIGLVAVGFFGVGSSDYWETPSSFGTWQEEIIVEFVDGTEESLKIMQEKNALFSVMYSGKAISKVRWLISGIATGEGFTKAVVQTSDLETYWKIDQSGGSKKDEGWFNYQFTLTDLWIGKKTSLNQGDIDVIAKIENNPSLYPAGTYQISFVPIDKKYQNTVVYWGMPQDTPYDEKTASLPPPRAIGLVVERTPTGSILVTVNSEIITYT